MGKLDWIVYRSGYFEDAQGNAALARQHRRTGVVQTEFRDGWMEAASGSGEFVADPWWVLANDVFWWLVIIVPPVVCLWEGQWRFALYAGSMSIAMLWRKRSDNERNQRRTG